MNSLTRYVAALAVAAILLATILVAFSTSSVEADTDLTIPSYGVVRGNEGDVVTVGSLDVPFQYQGKACVAELVGLNNESTHPNNDLTVKTGVEEYTFENIETEAFGKGRVNGTLTLGGVVVLYLTLGPSGVSSGGYAMNFDCQDPPPSTTVAPPPTTINEPPTTVAPPPTTLPPTPPEKNPPVTVPDYTG